MSTAQEILDYIATAGATLEHDFQLYPLQPDGFARLSLLTYEEVDDDDDHQRKPFKLDPKLFERLREKLDERNEESGNEPSDKGEVCDLVEWLEEVTFKVKLNLLLE